MFDFYHGGGLDLTCLGMAEVRRARQRQHVEVRRASLNGCGGFIDISQNSRAVVFAGTFTAGGLEVEIDDGKLKIVKEGRARKFVKNVEQITFSRHLRGRKIAAGHLRDRALRVPAHARRTGADRGGARHRHRASDILAHMDFKPIINKPMPMDRAHLRDEPMELMAELTEPQAVASASLRQRPQHPVPQPRRAGACARRATSTICGRCWSTRCVAAGRRVNSVVNHDGCRIAEDLYDDYAEMIQYMMENHYLTTTRYTTSAFMRLKMQEALSKRGLAPHIFERKEDAHAFLEDQAAE